MLGCPVKYGEYSVTRLSYLTIHQGLEEHPRTGVDRFGQTPPLDKISSARRFEVVYAWMKDNRVTTRAPATDDRFECPIRGSAVDPETRCAHYDSERDVIAIKFRCCESFYPCFRCHEESTAHDPLRWPVDRLSEAIVFCGRCRSRISGSAYVNGDHTCPNCGGDFNPGCESHYDRYFAGQ